MKRAVIALAILSGGHAVAQDTSGRFFNDDYLIARLALEGMSCQSAFSLYNFDTPSVGMTEQGRRIIRISIWATIANYGAITKQADLFYARKALESQCALTPDMTIHDVVQTLID